MLNSSGASMRDRKKMWARMRYCLGQQPRGHENDEGERKKRPRLNGLIVKPYNFVTGSTEGRFQVCLDLDPIDDGDRAFDFLGQGSGPVPMLDRLRRAIERYDAALERRRRAGQTSRSQ